MLETFTDTKTIQTQSPYASNLDINTRWLADTASHADDILDFTERNPFERLTNNVSEHIFITNIRRLTIAFGQLFNNVIVQNKSSTGAVTKRYKVLFTYAPKEKFLVRLDEQSNLENREFAITLPRMGFEMTGLTYDPSRKLNKMQKFRQVKTNEDGKVLNFNYTPVPYNVNYSLNIFTATTSREWINYCRTNFTILST